MSRLDREKRKPYRIIGACLADFTIPPHNQPEILEKVLALRERDTELIRTLADLRDLSASVDRTLLAGFYILLGAVLFALSLFVLLLIKR